LNSKLNREREARMEPERLINGRERGDLRE
jgi:hypothetical protein